MIAFGATARTRLASGTLETKSLTAGFCQRPRNRIDAAAIGIAFDHGCALSLGGLCEFVPVGGNRGQIDLQHTSGFCFRRPVDECRKLFMVNNELAAAIVDFAADGTVDDDLGPRLDRQIA